MYCFKLIKHESLHLGEGKIIPRDAFESLLTAQELLQKIEEERHIVLAESKKKAEQAGFEEGLRQFNEQLLLFEDKLKVLRHEMQRSILPLVLKATKKIIGDELQQHPEAILSVVQQAIKAVAQATTVKLYVNRADLEYLEKEKEALKGAFEHLESLQIEERKDIEAGGCIIETEKGILNATLENQYRALERALEAHKRG